MHLTNTISFSKGCFPGQEVVARLKYLGKNKRLTYRVAIDSVDTPATGASIVDNDGAEAGKILNSCLNPDGKVEALAVMKISAIQDSLTLAGHSVQLLPLPYELDDKTA